MQPIDRLLKQGVSEVIIEEDVRKILEEGKVQLRVKYGVDPSRPDIHLGHYVCFRKLRQFQELGHKVILIIGDWTAQIGDPSGKSATRSMLTREEVLANAQTYMDQFFKVVDMKKTEVMWQSTWFGEFGLSNVIELTSRYTVAQMLCREDFSKRFAAGSPIAVTELLYPLLQAYDSIAINSDLELGGTDQKFNLLVGRDMQKEYGQKPQNILTVPILTGLDGVQKMSKSLGNYIGVTDPSTEMFGKIMSMPDRLIPEYYELLTDVPIDEIDRMAADMQSGAVNPRDLKMRLGQIIITYFHNAEAAVQAEDEFKRVFQRHEIPTEMPTIVVSDGETVIDLLVRADLAPSKGQAKRLIQQGGVKLDGRKVDDLEAVLDLSGPTILQVGKRNFARLMPQ